MDRPPVEQIPWYYRRWVVLCLLFFVLGPLALPLLWKSPRFVPWAKWGLTILMAAYCLWMGVIIADMTRAVVERYRALGDVFP